METTFEKLYEAKAKKENKEKYSEIFRFNILNRLFGRIVLKNIKRIQIKDKIYSMKNELEKLNKYYIHSLTEPTEDSIDLKMRIDNLEEKIKSAQEMYRTLFYGRLLKFIFRK